VQRVVEALLDSAGVDRVLVVGPLRELDGALAAQRSPRVRLVPQTGSLIANAWAGFQASQRLRGLEAEADPDRPVLFLSADLPLIQPEAIDDFLARCADHDARSADGPISLLAGIAEEAALSAYYPGPDRPGIVRPYVELRSGRYRLANVYVARPLRMGHRELLQEGFSHRKAKDWSNVLALAWIFFRKPGGWRGAWQVLCLQATRLASRWPGRIYRALRRRNTEEQIEAIGSLLLGGRMRLVATPFGALSIDVDDADDYRILQARMPDWSRPAREQARPA
jgi:hypothetical protein